MSGVGDKAAGLGRRRGCDKSQFNTLKGALMGSFPFVMAACTPVSTLTRDEWKASFVGNRLNFRILGFCLFFGTKRRRIKLWPTSILRANQISTISSPGSNFFATFPALISPTLVQSLEWNLSHGVTWSLVALYLLNYIKFLFKIQMSSSTKQCKNSL